MSDEVIRQMRAELAQQIVRGDVVVRATEITMLEDEIERRGLVEVYVQALIEEMTLFMIAVDDDVHVNNLIPPEIPVRSAIQGV